MLCNLISGFSEPPKDKPDYSLGKPRLWSYKRVYPFLDGVFQDVASTQVSSLSLNANGANASTLDATLNSFQAGVSFSPVNAAQNALLQQQNGVVSANAALQSQLLSQQAALTQQLVAANQQVGQDTVTLAQAQGATNPDATQVTQATQALATANANLTSLNNQLAVVKAQIPSTLYTSQTYTSPTAASVGSAALPTQLTTLTAPQGAPTAPSFPPSKQMDNQMSLLWERLSRLVGTLTQADSLKDYKLVLASFDVNLLPHNRKKDIFSVEYCVTETPASNQPAAGTLPVTLSATASCENSKAIVLDLFPSASAVNIVNNKYSDNRFGAAFVASLFSVSANASYNHERLKMSQSLGQSAYITGFGAGTPTFGWAFGRNLGDDSVSPGNRTVYAIIAVPKGSEQISIYPTRAGWSKEGSDDWYRASRSKYFVPTPVAGITSPMCIEVAKGLTTPACQLKGQGVSQVTYTPVEYDPTTVTNSAATMQITLTSDIDPQLTVTVDGKIIPRARDTFGRGIQNAGGSGGLLETNAYSALTPTMSWIPISSNVLTVSLNPAQVERRFPSIVLSSPLDTVNVSQFLVHTPDTPTPADVSVLIGGETFSCPNGCVSFLPPLSYRKSSFKQIILYHRDAPSAVGKAKCVAEGHCVTDLYISIPTDSTANQQSSNVPTLQILTSLGMSPWGGNPVVTIETMEGDAANQTMHLARVNCTPMDSRLHCIFPDGLQEELLQKATIQLHDPDHAGGPVSTWTNMGGITPTSDSRPIIFAISQPKWVNYCTEKARIGKADEPGLAVCAPTTPLNPNTALTGLEVCVGTINMPTDDSESIQLIGMGSATVVSQLTRKQCLGSAPGMPEYQAILLLPIKAYPGITDQMLLNFTLHPQYPATLANLHASAAPVVSYNADDFSAIYGQNLVFTHFRVGDIGASIALKCDTTGTSCVVSDPTTLKANLGTATGDLYFIDDAGIAVPMQNLKAGIPTTMQFQPKPQVVAANVVVPTPAPVGAPAPPPPVPQPASPQPASVPATPPPSSAAPQIIRNLNSLTVSQ